MLCRCMRPGKLVCPLEHSCEPWYIAAACALASLCARWDTLVSLGACRCMRLGELVCPLGHSCEPGCFAAACALASLVCPLEHSCEPGCFAAACALASLCARWNTLVSLGALPLLAHKLAKAHAAAKHPGSQECSNGHTSSPRRKQRQSTQAHKSVPTGTQARQGANRQRQAQQSTKAHKHVPTAGTQARRSNSNFFVLSAQD